MGLVNMKYIRMTPATGFFLQDSFAHLFKPSYIILILITVMAQYIRIHVT